MKNILRLIICLLFAASIMVSFNSCEIPFLNNNELDTPETPEEPDEPEIPVSLESSEGLKFGLVEGGGSYKLLGFGTCTDEDVVIDTYNDLPVTGIAAEALEKNKTIRSLTLGPNVKGVSREAFASTEIEKLTFYTPISFADDAFSSCSKLKEVHVPSISVWMESGFYSGTSSPLNENTKLYVNGKILEEIEIPEDITVIKKNTFRNMNTLKRLHIGDHVTRFEGYAFSNCISLEEVHISDLSAWCRASFENWDANPLLYGASLYLNGERIVDLVIPSDIKEIKEHAFYGFRDLLTLDTGDSVEEISNYAFSNCTNLTSVRLGSSLKKVEFSSFRHTYRLVEIYNYSSYEISGANEYIDFGYNALSVHTDRNAPTTIRRQGDFVFYENGDDVRLVAYIGDALSVTLPDSLNGKSYIINNYAFAKLDNLEEIICSDGVTAIESRAFYESSALKNIVLSESVKRMYSFGISKIDPSAFPNIMLNEDHYGYYLGTKTNPYYAIVEAKQVDADVFVVHPDTKIIVSVGGIEQKFIEFPDTIESICYGAFGSVAFDELTIPENVSYLGDYAFARSSLKRIVINCDLDYISDGMFFECNELEELVLPEGIKSIGAFAFQKCGLKSFVIPDSVTELGQDVFSGSALQQITIGSGITEIPARAFLGCTDLRTVKIPSNVKKIDIRAFEKCRSLYALTVGSGVKSIGEGAFTECNILTEVYNHSSLPKRHFGNATVVHNSAADASRIYIDDEGYVFYVYGDTCLLVTYVGDALPNDLILPESCNGKSYDIRDYALSSRGINSLVIPDCVKKIGKYAFSDCISLATVDLGQVVEIGAYAFYNTNILENIFIPKTVMVKGEFALYCHREVKNIVFEETEGWYMTTNSTSEVPSADLKNPAKVRTYFTRHMFRK